MTIEELRRRLRYIYARVWVDETDEDVRGILGQDEARLLVALDELERLRAEVARLRDELVEANKTQGERGADGL